MKPANRTCVIVPAYNEAATIVNCIRELRKAIPSADILVVDNASTDGTAEIARQLGVAGLREPKPGKGHAVCTGMRQVLAAGYDWVALHDADDEYSAFDLGQLISNLVASAPNEAVMGVGVREFSVGKVLWRSLLANWLAQQALAWKTGSLVPNDILTGARVFNRAAAQKLFDRAPIKGFELEAELTRRALQANVKIVEGSIRYRPRAVAEKKIKPSDMFPILRACLGR